MRFHKTRDPDVLATRYESKTPNVVFAILCFSIGIPAGLAGLGMFGWEADAPPAVGLLIGIALCAGGVGILTYRRGFILDRRRGVLIRWRGAFGLRATQAMRLGDIGRVSLGCERREKPDRSGSSYIVYPIWIHGRGEAFKLSDELEREAARGKAEDAAEVLGVEWVDRSEEMVHKDEWW